MGILGVTFSKKEDEKYINTLNDLQQTQNELNEYKEKFSAIDKVQAVIEFRPDGTIVNANDNFLKTMGYELNEIKDRHHKMFVDPAYAESADYRRFWERLRSGENFSDEFSRISKDGSLRWLQAAYTPITDQNGNIYKIVKFATDITTQKIMNSDFQGQIEAINRSYAVIEFDMDGTVLTANKLFLDTMGYDLDEVKGRHHSIFVDNNYKNSEEYKRFWQDLNDGKFSSNEYKRFRKNGKEIWILASYNPVFDQQGKPYKVVKFATDVTEQKLKNADFEGQLTAIRKSQAVIEFDMQGNILEANDLFLEVMGYSLDEIKGKHHSIFVEQEYSRSAEYHDFWRKLNSGEFFSNEFKRIGKGGKIVWIQASYNPILDLNGKPFKVVKFASDVSQQKNHEEVARIKHALDYVSASVMIADHNNNIIYLNQAVEKMLQHAEVDIRKDLSNFSASQLLGQSMDFYHENPEHQKRLISSLTTTHTGEILLGGRTFRLVVNPVFNEDGRLGTVVEWYDRTTEVAIEKEIDNVVEAASKGDFNQQIDVDRKRGFFKSFSEKLNELCGTSKVVLSDIQHAFSSLAQGDLTKRITNDYEGGYQRLKENLNSTTDKITEVITEILNSSITIEGASNEITQGNLDLSQRTEEQASSLEETASSMEEMTTSVKQCSSMASEANKKSGEAVELAKTGGAIVQESIGAMVEISKASKKIAEIISVIDDIAFQTNLLALNAAVEAARAGDQGKGFAVVAGEVRNLSQRSAGAAKEIKELIQDSLNKVENGTVLAKKSGETLSSIIGSISNVSSAMEELKKATYEQSIGIEQVNKAISQMDEMTQQNAALVEESSAASKSLLDSAKKLNETVGFFKIKLEQPAEKKFHSNHYERTAPIRRKPSPVIQASQEQGDLEWEDF